MIELILMIKRHVGLLFIMFTLFLCSKAISSERFNFFGKIIYKKNINEFYFVYNKGSDQKFIPIIVENKTMYDRLIKVNKKFVKLNGHFKWIQELVVEFSRQILKIDVLDVKEFSFEDLRISRAKFSTDIEDINYFLLEYGLKNTQKQNGIPVSDKSANAMLAGAGVILAFAVGPIALIPATAVGIKMLFLDD